MSDCPAIMDVYYDDATEGDLTGDEVTAGRLVIADLGLHDAAYEYYRLITSAGAITKGECRKLMCAFQQDTTV